MNLIADSESTLRLPLPVLRKQPLPLPSSPVEHRLQEQDEPEETFVSFRRRASLSDAERDDRYILTRANLDSLCYGPAHDSLPPWSRPPAIWSPRPGSPDRPEEPFDDRKTTAPAPPKIPWRVESAPAIEALLADCFPESSILIEHREAVAIYTAQQASINRELNNGF